MFQKLSLQKDYWRLLLVKALGCLIEPETWFDHFVVLAPGLNHSFCRGGGFGWSDCSYKHLFQLLHVNWKGDYMYTNAFHVLYIFSWISRCSSCLYHSSIGLYVNFFLSAFEVGFLAGLSRKDCLGFSQKSWIWPGTPLLFCRVSTLVVGVYIYTIVYIYLYLL